MPSVAMSSAPSPKKGHHERADTFELQRVLDDVRHQPHVVNGECPIDALHGTSNLRKNSIRGQRRAHDEKHGIDRDQRRQQIEFGFGHLVQAVIANVADHANDFKPIAVGPVQTSRGANRIPIRPVTIDCRLVDNGEEDVLAGVRLGEKAAGAQRSTHRRQETWSDKEKGDPASFVPGWPSLDVNSSAHAAAVERQLIDHPRTGHARDRFECVDQAFLKRHKRFRSDDPPGRAELKRQEIGGIEASGDPTEIAKMDDEDDGDREQR
jgi:hypothetical protein